MPPENFGFDCYDSSCIGYPIWKMMMTDPQFQALKSNLIKCSFSSKCVILENAYYVAFVWNYDEASVSNSWKVSSGFSVTSTWILWVFCV